MINMSSVLYNEILKEIHNLRELRDKGELSLYGEGKLRGLVQTVEICLMLDNNDINKMKREEAKK